MINDNNNNLFANTLLDNNTFNRSLNNLQGTLDPRDQLAHDIRSFQQTGIGNPTVFLQQRLGQIDPRDQEAFDIRQTLNRLGGPF